MSTRDKIAITDILIESCVGSEIHDVHGAVLTNLSLAKVNKVVEVESDLDNSSVASICNSIDRFTNNSYIGRMDELLIDIFPKLLNVISGDLINKRVILISILPNSYTSRSEILASDFYRDYYEEKLKLIPGIDDDYLKRKIGIKFCSDNSGVLKQLAKAVDMLHEDKCDAIIFGGSDSLVNINTCSELYQCKNLKTEDQTAGTSPGEASAYLVLKSHSKAVKNKDNIYGLIDQISAMEEPNNGKASSSKMQGLAKAIKNILGSKGSEKDIDSIFTSISTYKAEVLEWHQVEKQLIGEDTINNNRVATVIGSNEAQLTGSEKYTQFNTQISLGDIGCATMPMLIGLAAYNNLYVKDMAHFGFQSADLGKKNIVCEMGNTFFRGAISILSHEESRRKTFTPIDMTNNPEISLPEEDEEEMWAEM